MNSEKQIIGYGDIIGIIGVCIILCVYDTKNETVLMWNDAVGINEVNYSWADLSIPDNYAGQIMLCCENLEIFNHDLISESPRFIKGLREEIEKNEWNDEESLVDLKLRYLKTIRIVEIIGEDLNFTVSHKFNAVMYHEFAGDKSGWQL
jgi:hypothetical protein